MKTLSNSQLSIQISSHGAELCSIYCDGKEYLWQADPTYWKRHSPVLFPIVGSLWENLYRHDGKIFELAQHGFARDMDFELVFDSADEVCYRLIDNEKTHLMYPFSFTLEIGYRITGRQIEVIWRVKNTDEKTIHFQIGAHPAFNFPEYDASNPQRGYFGFDRSEGLHYILIAEKGCVAVDTSYPLELANGLLPLNIHTFDKDALILEDNQVKEVTLYNCNREPVLALYFDAPVVGLWSPPAKNAPFVCIEPWYGRCDRVGYTGEYKEKDWMQHLQSGETFNGGYIIEIK